MPEIRYTFVATGQDTVARATEGIGQSFERSGKAATSAGRAGVAAAQAQAKAAQYVAAIKDRFFAAEQKAAERSATQEVKAAEKAAKEKAKAAEHVFQIKQRFLDREAKAEEAAQAKRIAAFEKANSKIASGLSGLAKGIGRGVLGQFGAGFLMGGVGGIIGKGIETIGGATRESIQLQGAARRIAINARRAGQVGVDPTALRKEFENAAIATPGVSSTEVASSVEAFREKSGGDLESARRFAGVMATAQSATGLGGEEIGGLAARLAKRFDIKSVQEMGDAIAQVTFAAKQSGTGLEEAIGSFDKLSASAKRFGFGEGPQGISRLTALSNIAREGVGEKGAAAAADTLLRTIGSRADKLKAAGVDVFAPDKSGRRMPIEQVLAQTIAKVGSSDNMALKTAALQKMLGARGYGALDPLVKTYATTFTSTSGTTEEKTKAASDAVIDAFNKAGAAAGNYSELQRDAATAQGSSAAQLTKAWEQIKAVVGDKFAPKITELIGKLAGGAPGLDLLAKSLDVAVDALNGLGYWAKKYHLMDDDKGGSRTEAIGLAAGKSKEISALLGGADINSRAGQLAYDKLSPEQKTTVRELNAQQLEARAKAERLSSELGDEKRKQLFEQRYADLASPEGPGRDIYLAHAKKITSADYDPNERLRGDEYSAVSQETSAQKQEREAFASKTGDYKDTGAEDMKKAAVDIREAAGVMKEAVSKAGGGNAFNGGAPGSAVANK